MRYTYKDAKPKIRRAAAIGLTELSESNKTRELATELVMIDGYVGYIDADDYGVRIYIFEDAASAKSFVREASKIGYRTAGDVEGSLIVKNTELERPHLRYLPKKSFMRELYK